MTSNCILQDFGQEKKLNLEKNYSYWRGSQERYLWLKQTQGERSQADQHAVKTLKLCREECWDEFYKHQHCHQAAEADGQ